MEEIFQYKKNVNFKQSLNSSAQQHLDLKRNVIGVFYDFLLPYPTRKRPYIFGLAFEYVLTTWHCMLRSELEK